MSKRHDEDFHAEIEAHLQLEIDELVDGGMSRAEAARAAHRAFGNVTRSRERFYESNRWLWLDHLARNTRYALRQMKRAPVSTAAILLSLALGVGLNTSIFSLADQALVRPLPVEDPQTLVQLKWNGIFVVAGMGSNGYGNLVPFPLYHQLRDEGDVFADLFARTTANVHLALKDRSLPVNAEIVTGSFFETLGVNPRLGRLFTESDDVVPGGHPQAVISHEFWWSQFAGRESVLGEQLRINGVQLTIIGVAEKGFQGTDWSVAPSIWIPMMMKEAVTGWGGLDEHRSRFAHVFGRLKDGSTRSQAVAHLEPLFDRYLLADTELADWPSVSEDQLAGFLGSQLDVVSGAKGQSWAAEEISSPLLILAGATGLVFLLACLNVANLSVARVLGARRATALRTALGASRRRILGESLVESTVFAVIGGTLGALLAPTVSRFVLTMLGEGAGGTGLNAGLDLRVLGFALATTAVLTVLAGTTPALFAAATPPALALQQRGADGMGGPRGAAVRKAFVVAQFSLALLLLVSASLFAQTLGKLRAEGPGFSTTNLLMLEISPRNDGYDAGNAKTLVRRLQERLEALPETAEVGVAAHSMLSGGSWNNPVTVVTDQMRVATDRSLPMNAITPGFFEALGAKILMGRSFDETDSVDEGWDLRSVILNKEFVDRYLEGKDPVGGRLAFGTAPDALPEIEVIGVVESFQDTGLREPEPQIYFSLWERRVGSGTIYLRTTTDSEYTMNSVRTAMSEVDPTLTAVSLRTVDDQLDRLLVTERVLSTLASAFAVLATVLAMIGLYGVLSFSAERRRNEIGIRMALGASRWSAGSLLVREAAALAVLGLVIALPAVWGVGQLVENQLFGVQPTDLASILAAAAILFAAVLAASAYPARKLSRVKPLEALRAD